MKAQAPLWGHMRCSLHLDGTMSSGTSNKMWMNSTASWATSLRSKCKELQFKELTIGCFRDRLRMWFSVQIWSLNLPEKMYSEPLRCPLKEMIPSKIVLGSILTQKHCKVITNTKQRILGNRMHRNSSASKNFHLCCKYRSIDMIMTFIKKKW